MPIPKFKNEPFTEWSKPENRKQQQQAIDAIAEVPGKATLDPMEQPLGEGFVLTEFIEEMQRCYLIRAMKESGGVKTKAAELLGYKNYQTLAAQLDRLKIENPTER